ncbi:uncharacterized protein [Littorina saxatilis]|uniref:uncharacterized protein n=1 Tax=Littorina saxatilis TaxID=31220 RepID=UPI0038B462C9
MLDLSKDLEPNGGDVVQLKKELAGEAIPSDDGHSNQTWHHYMSVLCLRPKEQRVEKTHPWHVCRYRAARGLPYLRYKEEILSLAPFVSLFYNIVHDTEIDNIKQFVKGSMFRGKVGQGKDAETVDIRTSDVGWVDDRELETTKTVSQRVKVITGLEVDQRAPLGPSSAEAMQFAGMEQQTSPPIHRTVQQQKTEVPGHKAGLRQNGATAMSSRFQFQGNQHGLPLRLCSRSKSSTLRMRQGQAINNTRGFKVPNSNTERHRNSFFVKTVLEWNQLTDNAIDAITAGPAGAAPSAPGGTPTRSAPTTC